MPERVVAYLPLAAALWDYGVRPTGVFGTAMRPDGTPEVYAGVLEIDSVTNVGQTYSERDLERLFELDADPFLSDMRSGPPDIWRPDEDARPSWQPSPQCPDQVRGAGSTPERSTLLNSALFPELGLEMIEPASTASKNSWEELSWEQAGKHPADLFLIDARQSSFTGDQLVSSQPTFASLLAAWTSQLGGRDIEFVSSDKGFTPVVQRLTEVVTNADPGIVP